jgi:phospholipid/cholesterol/gamma-HCH transport system substrate-binding protein
VSLEEEGGGPGRPLTRAQGSEHPLLASAPSRIVSLDTTMSDLNRNVQQVTGTLQAALDPATLATLKQSLADLQVVTHTLAENNARMERILANAERASVQAQGTLARIDGVATATDARLGTILRNTEQASARFEPLLQAGNDTLYALQVQLIPETQRTLARLDQLSTSLGDTAARVRRNPALLVRGTAPAAAGPGEGP